MQPSRRAQPASQERRSRPVVRTGDASDRARAVFLGRSAALAGAVVGLHVVFHLQHLALAPAKGHAGFEKLRFGETAEIATGNYMHYLHHRYFEVNYGSDLVPIDKWVGTFHDGSEAAEQAMNARLRRRRERAVAKG